MCPVQRCPELTPGRNLFPMDLGAIGPTALLAPSHGPQEACRADQFPCCPVNICSFWSHRYCVWGSPAARLRCPRLRGHGPDHPEHHQDRNPRLYNMCAKSGAVQQKWARLGAGGARPGSYWPLTEISVGPDGTNGWSLKRRILNVGSQHQFCQPQIAEY